MIRKAFILSLVHGREAEYEARHKPIWTRLAAALKNHGAHNYSIFLHKEGGQLFAYLELEDEARWAAFANSPECRDWRAYMQDVLRYDGDGTPVTEPLREVFHLD